MRRLYIYRLMNILCILIEREFIISNSRNKFTSETCVYDIKMTFMEMKRFKIEFITPSNY